MTSAGGHWVRVRFADASFRLDWIPDAQPPTPDGAPGAWHVVPDPGGNPSRWEWHPRSSPLPVVAAEQAPPPADSSETQPLPRQVIPNRPRRASVPSVHPSPRPGGSRSVLPALRMRWAAWSLSVVLAVPVVYLLARPSADDPSRTSAQSELESAQPEEQIGTGLPGFDPTSTAPDAEPTAPTPGDEATDRYLRHLLDLDTTQGYSFGSLGEQFLLTTGADACADLDRGAAYDVVRQGGIGRVPNGGQLVVAAAATYLCPQHHAKLQAFSATLQ